MNSQPTITNQGLSSAEAAARLNKYGLNEIVKAKKLSGFLDFISRFKNPLLIILIVSAVISGVLGDPVTAGIIIFIVLVSVLIDFINTYKSQKAAEDLKKRVMVTTTVIRDGAECEIGLADIVPGDAVLLNPGDIIPADGLVSEAKDLFINESQLTGESFPAEKKTGLTFL